MSKMCFYGDLDLTLAPSPLYRLTETWTEQGKGGAQKRGRKGKRNKKGGYYSVFLSPRSLGLA